jgi:voltage-gated potassium channel
VLLFAIILVIFSSYIILQIEKNSPEKNIMTSTDAIWWSIVTITTVGYGDLYPTTTSGRMVAALLMIVGIGIFSSITSYLSTTFISRRQRKSSETQHESEAEINAVEINTRLIAIEDQLRELSDKLQKIAERNE